MKAVITTKKQDTANKSKTYIKYQKLLLDIEEQQKFRSNLQEGLQKAYSKIENELSPLQKERNVLFRSYIIRLDELVDEIGIGKFNREWYETYIIEELEILLEFFGHQDKILSKLYEKYADVSLDDIAKDDDAIAMAQSLSEMFGFEVDAKEILEKGEKAFFEEYKHKILDHIKNNSADFSETFADEEKQEKKKSKNDKAAVQDSQLTKDARSIYMRLVKKFHPDLEKDPILKDQNNEIVKQVTKAYQENDFFTLLKLQITYLEDNEAESATLADDMLKRYNKLLQKQLNELQAQIHEAHFTGGNIIADFIDKNGKFSPQKFTARRRSIEKENSMLKLNLSDSKKRPKGWFKEQISMIKDSVQQNMMQNMFADIFGDMKF